MELGFELIKEQQFFRKELRERVHWFIRLRWIAVGVALAVAWMAYLLGLELAIIPVTIILIVIFLYNVVLRFIGRRLESFKPEEIKPVSIFAHTQISLDLLALFFLVHFTGGIESPLLIFTIFHIILAGILLSPVSCFLYGILVLLATAFLIIGEKAKIFDSHFIGIQSFLFPHGSEYPHVFIPYLAFATAILVSVYFVSSLKLSLRTKGRELLRLSRELEAGNTKLSALYQMVKEMGTQNNLKDLMDAATLYGARIMGVKACSIKLLEDTRSTLRFASTYGLSEDYLSKRGIDLEKSPINLKIIQGSPYAIGHIHEKDYFQYPEDIGKEGIASMLCLPLRVEKMILGVFCVYSHESYRFQDRDVDFFSLMSDLTALAIETLKSQKTRAWFMTKAAHQLRSPLNAVSSMLKTLQRGYLGDLSEKQRALLARCDKRIALLVDLINDLLKLGKERERPAGIELHPVDFAQIINAMAPLYQTQASDKDLQMVFNIQKPLPLVMADEQYVDEIVINLISNAIKYTPSGGRVHVTLDVDGDGRVRFAVSDTGIGIPDEDMPRLFSEFFRAENAKAMVEEGTGLGLLITKEILDRLGGTIQMESKLGQGTCFTCTLPSIP